MSPQVFNNLIVSLTNKSGQVISWSSAGKMGFKGSKRIPLCGSNGCWDAAKKAFDAGLKRVDVFVKGPGAGREKCYSGYCTIGYRCRDDQDVTPLPHNGCRPPEEKEEFNLSTEY